MKYIIGIDFGTSTSMIKVAVRDGSNSLETKPVTFTQYGIGSTPTLIRKKEGVVWYGQDAAQNERMDTVLYRNFKLDLKSGDAVKQQEAMGLLEEFYQYLYKAYSEQKNFLIGTDAAEVETVVSYPAQWGKEQQEAVINAAKKTGFPNVTGMDEPTAAVICVLKAKQKELENSGLLRAGKPLNILIVDMGAGTTDLAFVTATVENGSIQTNIRETWPKADSEHIYGGSQMDLRLEAIMENWLTQSGIAPMMVQNLITGQRNNIKSWKESTLSALLEKGLVVDEFSAITNMLMMMGMPVNPFPSISKETFMDYFRPELESFVNVIASAPQNLRDETELVILTGGNSVWYWVRPIVLGIDTRFGDVGLKNIRRISNRVLQMEQPADTVSRGLVYDKSSFRLAKTQADKSLKAAEPFSKMAGANDTSVDPLPNTPPQQNSNEDLEFIEEREPTCKEAGIRRCWHKKSNDTYYADANGYYVIYDVQKKPLGHNFVWEQRGKFQMQICSRCGAVGETKYYDPTGNKAANTTKETVRQIPTESITGSGKIAAVQKPAAEAISLEYLKTLPPTDENAFLINAYGNDCGIKKYIGHDKIIVVPSSIRGHRVVSIDRVAFGASNGLGIGAAKITAIVIPSSVHRIDVGAFYGCSKLKTVIMGDSVTTIGSSAFRGCVNIQNIQFGDNPGKPGVVYFPKKLKEIGFGAFSTMQTSRTYLNEVWLSKDTILRTSLGMDKAFTPKTCAIFYYSK